MRRGKVTERTGHRTPDAKALHSALRLVAVAAGAVAVGLVSLSAASASGPSANAAIPVLRVAWTSQYATLDPGNTAGCNTLSCGTLFDRLMTIDAKGQLVGALATSLKQRSPKTYIVELRRGVKFWNGNELTSADVENALNYQRHPSLNSSAVFGPTIKNIKATGRYTVVITLKRPDPGFKYLLALEGPIFEKKFQQEHKSTFGKPGTLVMGSGPWKVDSFDPTKGVELSRNRQWWGGEVPFPRISIKFITDENGLALAFRAGDIDVAFPSNIRAFESTSGANAITKASPFSHSFWSMNYHKAPWDDVHVRRAVAYAINRTDIIAASGSPASPAYYMIPPRLLRLLGSKAQVNAALKGVPTYHYSLAKARQEMAQSAYPNGFSDTNDVVDFASYVAMAQVIAAQLDAIGIKLKLNRTPVTNWFSLIFGPKTYGTMLSGGAWPIPDPSGFPSLEFGSKNVRSGALNYANYDPPAVDTLLDAGLSESDPAKRLAIYGRFLKRVGADTPYVPLGEGTFSVALSKNLTWPGFGQLEFYLTYWPMQLKQGG